MPITHQELDRVPIHLPCPICGKNKCMEMSLFKKQVQRVLYKYSYKKIRAKLYCTTTNTWIHVVLWDEEVEKLFIENKRRFTVESISFTVSSWSYILLCIAAFEMGGLLFLNKTANNNGKDITPPTESPFNGDVSEVGVNYKMKVILTLMEGKKWVSTGYTWFIVRERRGRTLLVQQHDLYTVVDTDSFNLSDENFNGPHYEISAFKMAQRLFLGSNTTYFSGYIEEGKY